MRNEQSVIERTFALHHIYQDTLQTLPKVQSVMISIHNFGFAAYRFLRSSIDKILVLKTFSTPSSFTNAAQLPTPRTGVIEISSSAATSLAVWRVLMNGDVYTVSNLTFFNPFKRFPHSAARRIRSMSMEGSETSTLTSSAVKFETHFEAPRRL